MKNKPAPSDVTYDQLLQRAEHFCAWRDRCVWEVEEKLRALGADSLQRHQIIDRLSEDGFLDEPRYVRSFIRGKLHNNQWGRIRIIREL
ncbi:MAG: RecX family transcriptional regulator, partial [Bacteroidales bacterium]